MWKVEKYTNHKCNNWTVIKKFKQYILYTYAFLDVVSFFEREKKRSKMKTIRTKVYDKVNSEIKILLHLAINRYVCISER